MDGFCFHARPDLRHTFTSVAQFVLSQHHTSLARTNRCLERTRAFVALRIETKETNAAERRRLSPQRLCSSAERRCHKTSFDFTAQSEPRRTEALRVCWDDRNSRQSAFENHRNGYKSAWVVRKYGVRLMPELYEHFNPMPFEAAVQMETDLADDLRAAGYTVTGGH